MTTFGAEHPTSTCALHFGSPIPDGRDSCVLCDLAGVRVVVTSPERVSEIIGAAERVGTRYLPLRSRAVLVFARPEGPLPVGELLRKPPGASARHHDAATPTHVVRRIHSA